jgi:hypothetical protein
VKRFWVLAVLMVLVCIGLAGCSRSMAADLPVGTAEVLPNCYDDNQAVVYIRVADPTWKENDQAVIELMTTFESWKNEFLDKQVVTWSLVTGNSGGWNMKATVFGLLVYYELSPPAK